MKAPALPLLALGCLCVFVAGCNRAPSTAAPPTANATANNGGVNVTVSGQVFIVTKSGESIKLGLVHVAIDDRTKAMLEEKSTTDALNGKLSQAKKQIDAALPTFQEAYDKYNTLLPDYKNAQKTLNDVLDDDGVYRIPTTNVVSGVDSAQAANIVKLDRQLADIGARLAPLHDDAMSKFYALRSLIHGQQTDEEISIGTFFDYFLGQADTKTDADGKFTLSVSEGGKYVIVAGVERSVGDGKEQYCWLEDVDLTSAENGVSVLLSNDNQVDPLSRLKVDKSLMADDVPDLPLDMYEDIVKAPRSLTFKSLTGDLVTPSSSGDDSASNTATAPASTPAAPVWTPPDPWPKQDNWTWKTTDGTYENVVITQVSPEIGVLTIMHSGGIAQVEISSVPPDIQKMLNYPPSAAQASTSTNTPSSVNQ